MQKGRARAPRAAARADKALDRSFGEILQTKSAERIVPDVMNRIEGGRQRYVKHAAEAAEAELALLRAERQRLAEGPPQGRARIPRLDGVMAAVAADAHVQRATAGEFARAVPAQPGGWTVLGRVLRRDGTPPGRASVEFVTDGDQPVKELGAIPVERDGSVRKAYPAEVVARLATRRVVVAAAVRVGARVVTIDDARVAVGAGGLHQFDLRVESVE